MSHKQMHKNFHVNNSLFTSQLKQTIKHLLNRHYIYTSDKNMFFSYYSEMNNFIAV